MTESATALALSASAATQRSMLTRRASGRRGRSARPGTHCLSLAGGSAIDRSTPSPRAQLGGHSLRVDAGPAPVVTALRVTASLAVSYTGATQAHWQAALKLRVVTGTVQFTGTESDLA